MRTTPAPAPHLPLFRTPGREVVERAETVIRGVRELQGTPVLCRFDNGVLSLHGRVHSFHAKQLAQTAAAGIDGVSRIDNELEVVPGRSPHTMFFSSMPHR